MTIVVTGSDGFLGHHLRARLRAAGHLDVLCVPRSDFGDEALLEEAVRKATAVVHLAGVNRGDAQSVETGNIHLAEGLVAALESSGSRPRLLFADSVHSGLDTPYGRGKERSSALLGVWAEKAGAQFVDLVLPNLFGEYGRPDHNSFVATFCHRLATGQEPKVDVDRELELLHAQDAAQVLIEHLAPAGPAGRVQPAGLRTSVGEVLNRLGQLAAIYDTGTIPDLTEPFTLQLFNTYRSYLYPDRFPMALLAHTDPRGSFVEAAKSLGGQSQSSFSTTRPGIARGDHFHLRKVERFVVLRGRARIAVRPLWSKEVWSFEVSGDEPAFVDMPTLAAHNITNVGDDDLYTCFWINEVFDPANSDTFAEVVE